MFNKKFIILLIFVCFMVFSSVNALEFHQQDFNGFKMDVPEGMSFHNENILIDPDLYGTDFFLSEDNSTRITFLRNCYNETYLNDTFESLKSQKDLVISRDGDLYSISSNSTKTVIFQNDTKIIGISSYNLNDTTLKEMANSCVF